MSEHNAESDATHVILKYRLEPDTSVATYEGVRWLHVETQNGEPHVWAEVNTLTRECMKRIVVVPTGGDVPRGGTYLGTATGVDGWGVFHAYECAFPPGGSDA